MNKKISPKTSETKVELNYDDQIKANTKGNIAIGLDDNINSKNSPEKSRTVNIDGKEYTRTVSEIFATDKNFKNFVDISGEGSEGFKYKLKKLKKVNKKPVNYAIWQDIISVDTTENLKLNGKIIEKIVAEYYNGSGFDFLKDSGLVLLNGDKIDKSELTSYLTTDGYWRFDLLGKSGFISLRAINDNGEAFYIEFKNDSANLFYYNFSGAMRVASQK